MQAASRNPHNSLRTARWRWVAGLSLGATLFVQGAPAQSGTETTTNPYTGIKPGAEAPAVSAPAAGGQPAKPVVPPPELVPKRAMQPLAATEPVQPARSNAPAVAAASTETVLPPARMEPPAGEPPRSTNVVVLEPVVTPTTEMIAIPDDSSDSPSAVDTSEATSAVAATVEPVAIAPAASGDEVVVEVELLPAGTGTQKDGTMADAAPDGVGGMEMEQQSRKILRKVEAAKLYSFEAVNTEIKTALALFAKANELNIVPDFDVTGTVTLSVRDLPLHQMMRALLEANDFSWEEEGGLIRVKANKTETFTVDYLRLSRTGQGQNSASLSAAGGGGRGGGSGGGGGGMGGGGGGGGGSQGGSAINLTADNPIDFWKELQEELGKLLTAKGKETMAVNMTAGMIQITDRPSALRRVARYLDDMEAGVERQVDLEVKLYDVMLDDEFQLGIDWEVAAQAGSAMLLPGGSTIVTAPIGGLTPSAPTLDLGGTWTFQDGQVTAVLQAMQQQGEVKVISKPRIRTMNNQTALIKVGTETPFFRQNSTVVPGVAAGGSTVLQDDEVTTITVGTILSITPQIAEDGWITLDISPVLTSLVGVELSPSETSTAPVLDIKQASTIVRVRNGSTIVMGGLIQDAKSRTVRKIPIAGDIPLIGKLFQGRYEASQKKELVIFVTPRIVKDAL
jgi:MSHA type pilus biogenesis protein MshL